MNIEFYLKDIDNISFYPMRDTPEIWAELQDEGLFDEYDEGNFIDNWVVGKLKISTEHKEGLSKLVPEVVELFNELDIKVKEKYCLKIIDFINYDIGEVILVKYLR